MDGRKKVGKEGRKEKNKKERVRLITQENKEGKKRVGQENKEGTKEEKKERRLG